MALPSAVRDRPSATNILTSLSQVDAGLINKFWVLKFEEWTPITFPDSNAHCANMGLIWVLTAPVGPHFGPWNLLLGLVPIPVYHHEKNICTCPSRTPFPHKEMEQDWDTDVINNGYAQEDTHCLVPHYFYFEHFRCNYIYKCINLEYVDSTHIVALLALYQALVKNKEVLLKYNSDPLTPTFIYKIAFQSNAYMMCVECQAVKTIRYHISAPGHSPWILVWACFFWTPLCHVYVPH